VSEVLPVTVDTSSTKALGQLNVTNAGIRISNPNELKTLELPANKTKDFALSSDIDLDEAGVEWDGPENYSGKFYGNGYTIKLVLSKNTTYGDPSISDKTSLFSTLGNGALVQDIIIDASITEAAKARKGSTYFGGVVGRIYLGSSNSASVTLRGIKTKGTLDFTSEAAGFILVGGLIGELGDAGIINIENCGSELNASMASYTYNAEGRLAGFGGFIGRIVANKASQTLTVNITNSYATGNLSVAGNITTASLFCGGFIGDALTNNGGSTLNLTMRNCYAAGNIAVSNTGELVAAGELGAGGLIGFVWKTAGTTNVTLNNCAVVGQQVLLDYVDDNTPYGQTQNNRFVAVSTADPPTSLIITNGIARKGMLTGATPGTGDTSDGALTAQSGLGKTDEELKTATTWINANWSDSVWDFSGLPSGKWPTLK
ncbi:MAG: hypothetical protein LBD22_05810, partial [Spirochaetaceae bacterium]|jgi:hypothetical protein|nr:hypothetical protein [Spirochaetaceae bacterium]